MGLYNFNFIFLPLTSNLKSGECVGPLFVRDTVVCNWDFSNQASDTILGGEISTLNWKFDRRKNYDMYPALN